MPDKKTSIGIYSLAVLPLDYLSQLDDPFEKNCADQNLDPGYHEVFMLGIKGYQLVSYLELTRERYGRGVASQIGNYLQCLLEKEPGGKHVSHTMKLIRTALRSDTVAADTANGRFDIPIEMNVALSLLLGATSSPHYVSHPDQHIDEIRSIGLDVDWLMSRCLTRARDEVRQVFSPLLACIESGVQMDFVEAYLNERIAIN